MPQKEHRTGNLSPEFALLGFLIVGSSHGYDLHQRFTVELGHVWHLSQSQAYAILNRLEQRGDITSQIVEQEKLPARQKLRITAQGRHRFFKWLEQGIATNSRSIRLEFLTRLYFTQLHNPEHISRIYNAQVDEIEAAIERIESLLENLPPEQVFNRLSLDLRLQQMQVIQNWIDEIGTLFQIARN